MNREAHDPQEAAGEEREEPLMKFGRAPNIFGIIAGLVGGIGVVVWPSGAFSTWQPTEQVMGVLAGLVLGYGAGWLFGLIGAMGWLGE